MSHLEESGGRISLTFDGRPDSREMHTVHANGENGWVAVSGCGYTVTFHVPSPAVARKLAELFDRQAELLSIVEWEGGDASDWTAHLDYRNHPSAATK